MPSLQEQERDRGGYEQFFDEFLGEDKEVEEKGGDGVEDMLPSGARIVRVLGEIERADGGLWFRVKFDKGAVMEVSSISLMVHGIPGGPSPFPQPPPLPLHATPPEDVGPTHSITYVTRRPDPV